MIMYNLQDTVLHFLTLLFCSACHSDPILTEFNSPPHWAPCWITQSFKATNPAKPLEMRQNRQEISPNLHTEGCRLLPSLNYGHHRLPSVIVGTRWSRRRNRERTHCHRSQDLDDFVVGTRTVFREYEKFIFSVWHYFLPVV